MAESTRFCDGCGDLLESGQARFCGEMCRTTYMEVFRSAPDEESGDEDDEQLTREELEEAELSGDALPTPLSRTNHMQKPPAPSY